MRQHDVEDEQVVVRRQRLRQSRATVIGRIGGIAFRAHVLGHSFGKMEVVLDDQHALHRVTHV